jgi:hypothetical protein
MPVRRSRQGTNQAGALAPTKSVWGQTLAGATSGLIDQPLPIGSQGQGFGGTAGGLVTIAASVKSLIGAPGYWGDVPQSQQDTVDVSPPWERP